MRSRGGFVKIAVFTPLIIAIYYIRCQHIFQLALSRLSITFSDFPESYQHALNASRTDGNRLIGFEYDTTFGSPMIPPIIHFIYFADLYHLKDGTPSLPVTIRSHAPELCRKFNPSFEIRIWNVTEADIFINTEYPWFASTYNAYKHPIQRVDALKYFILYHFGGVYMDLDVACRRPLDPLLHFPAWFPEASPLGVNNDLMASIPRHPVLLDLTDALARRDWNLLFPYLTIFWSTGPQFSSDVLKEWWWTHDARMGGRDTASFRILPQIFYSEAYTFFGHSPGGTWHGSDVAVVLWIVHRPWIVFGILGSCIAVAFGALYGSRQIKVRHRHPEAGTLHTE